MASKEFGVLGTSKRSPTFETCLRRNPALCGPAEAQGLFCQQAKNGSAPSPRRWAAWTCSSSPRAFRKRAARTEGDRRGTGLSGIELNPNRNAKNASLMSGQRPCRVRSFARARASLSRGRSCEFSILVPFGRTNMKIKTLTPELLHQMDACWRAANYLSVGQIYLCDNPLLKRPLALTDVKRMLLGHWAQLPARTSSTCT